MRVLGLAGFAGSGKDTAAALLVKRGWHRAAFADPLRRALYALDPIVKTDTAAPTHLSTLVDRLGWDKTKRSHFEVRRLMQRMGTEVGRQVFGEAFWVSLMWSELGRIAEDNPYASVVITDVRFPNEAAMVRSIGHLVWVRRPGVGPVNDHVSERPIECPLEVVNDSSIDMLDYRLSTLIDEIHWTMGDVNR